METNYIEHLLDHGFVDEGIDRVVEERRDVVDLYQPGLQVLVVEDVETKELVAVVIGLDLVVDLRPDVIVSAEDCLDADLLGLLPQRPPIDLQDLLEVSPECFEVPLVANKLPR